MTRNKLELKYLYHRICELGGCDIEFNTNKKKHFFCCTEHQQEYWKRIRRGENALKNEVMEQREEIKEIKENIKQIKKYLNIKEV